MRNYGISLKNYTYQVMNAERNYWSFKNEKRIEDFMKNKY